MSSTANVDLVGDIGAPAKRTIYVPLDSCEWRNTGDPSSNETTLRGHAAVFNSMSEDLGGFREIIEPGFFRAALRKSPDVRLLFNHDPNYVMARTASGTLELREDNRGLHVFATIDKRITWTKDLRTSMQRGDIDQMSFAFTLGEDGDDWAVTDDGTIVRTLRADGADQIFDASVVTYPAYKATEVSMRSVLDEAIENGRVIASEVDVSDVEAATGVRCHHCGDRALTITGLGPVCDDCSYRLLPGESDTTDVASDVELRVGESVDDVAPEDEEQAGESELDVLQDLRVASRDAVAEDMRAYLRLLQELSK